MKDFLQEAWKKRTCIFLTLNILPLIKGRRERSKKVVILITDGQSNEQRHLTIPNAQELKKRQVKILVVAVGSYISGIDEMVKVASDPFTDMFRVKSLGEFHEIVRLVLEKISPGKWKIKRGQYNPPCW